MLKESYDVAKNNTIFCIWCNAMCLHRSRLKKNIIFHILCIIVAPLCSAFLKCADLYKAHRSEKWGVLWLASYPVLCDWLNTSRMWQKCYAPYHVVMLCPRATRPLYSVHITAIHSVTTQSLVIMFFFFGVAFFLSYVKFCLLMDKLYCVIHVLQLLFGF